MQKHSFHPTEIIFSATTACNLHCEHCFIERNPHKLEIADAVSLIESCVNAGSDMVTSRAKVSTVTKNNLFPVFTIGALLCNCRITSSGQSIAQDEGFVNRAPVCSGEEARSRPASSRTP